jgi:hypothetical protein
VYDLKLLFECREFHLVSLTFEIEYVNIKLKYMKIECFIEGNEQHHQFIGR